MTFNPFFLSFFHSVLKKFVIYKCHLYFVGDVTAINCNSYIRDIFLKVSFNNRQLPLIGPFSVKTEGSLASFFLKESFQMSQSIVTIATGLVPMHVGQEHVLCLKLFSEHLMELLNVSRYYIPTKRMFSGVYWNHPVCPSVHVSVCVQNISFFQSAGSGFHI